MLKCNGLGVTLGGQILLENVSFELPPRTFTALIGKNGSGKSTLAACIRQQVPYTGDLSLEDVSLREFAPRQRACRIASLPQTLPAPDLTVRELAGLGRSPYLGLNRRFSAQDRTAVDNALRRTEMVSFASRRLPTLSGGERQRAYLAMILAQDADVLVLDEPTAYMDIHAEAECLRMMRALTSEGKTLMVILHNLSLAATYADRLLVLDRHTCVFAGQREECLSRGVIESVFNVRRVSAPDDRDGNILFLA